MPAANQAHPSTFLYGVSSASAVGFSIQIAFRTRDRPVCCTLPQTTAPPRAPNVSHNVTKILPVLTITSEAEFVAWCSRLSTLNGRLQTAYVSSSWRRSKEHKFSVKISYQTGCKAVWFPFCQSPRHLSDSTSSVGAIEQHWDQLAEALPAPYMCTTLIDRSSVICSRNKWSSGPSDTCYACSIED
jgi:hypothetical protein